MHANALPSEPSSWNQIRTDPAEWDEPLPDPSSWEDLQPAKPPPITVGKLILKRLVIPRCPHCGERHRHRFHGWNQHYPAICAADGGYLVQQQQQRAVDSQAT